MKSNEEREKTKENQSVREREREREIRWRALSGKKLAPTETFHLKTNEHTSGNTGEER